MTGYSHSHSASYSRPAATGIGEIPFNTPVCLKAHTENNLQNQGIARCPSKSAQTLEQLELLRTEDDKVIIQSKWNNRTLQVQPEGRCVFKDHSDKSWEKFEVEFDEYGHVFFINCHTRNVLQCNANGSTQCLSRHRLCWERWRIVQFVDDSRPSVPVTKLRKAKYPSNAVIKLQLQIGDVRESGRE